MSPEEGRTIVSSDLTPHSIRGVVQRGSAIDETIQNLAPVRINVQGAFIVDENTVTTRIDNEAGAVHDSKDIRLPHHKSIVSHVAVDVSFSHGHDGEASIDGLRCRLEVLWPNWYSSQERATPKSLVVD